MLDFLFIVSPTNATNPYPPFYYLYLTAYLEAHGFSCRIVDPKGRGDHWPVIGQALQQYKARFVGLSALHPDYDVMVRLARLIKAHQPNTTLLVGNAHPTLQPEDFIFAGSPFDVAVRGEGEETCLALASLNHKQDVSGIAYFDEGIVQTGAR